ncbi:MAG TPA: amidohydrolase [Terriglobales bacterium]|nr:amidohydrolase [Terriglobales bacterium]
MSVTANSTAAAEKPPLHTVYFINGNVYTNLYAPAKAPHPRAIAVREGRIVAVGSNEEVLQMKRGQDEVIDLGGHFVMPGFNDAHVHLATGGLELLEVDLVGAKSLADMQQRIAEHAKTVPGREWLIGRGWDHTLWPGQKLPTRQDIDSVTGNHPAVFVRIDGHIAVANTAALKAAGIFSKVPDPHGGQVDREANGEATGIVRETAKDLILSKVPKPSLAMRRHGIELALANAARSGITSLQDYSEWEDFLVYEEMEKQGKLTVRISEWLPFNEPMELLDNHRAHHPADDPMLHTAMLKGFMDGSLGSRTAALNAPYSDDPGNKGLPQYEQATLNKMAVERSTAAFQLGFHAIGDAAVQMALDAFAEVDRDARENHREHDFRFRIEHDQVIDANQFDQFSRLRVIASVQPCHLLTDMNWVVQRIGPQRAKLSYPWASFLKHGIPLAFGTDYPVEPINPFRGLYAAVTRKNEAGTKEFFPEQKISMEQAIAAYTTGSAYAQYAEKDKGTLALGMLADFVVLDRDITKVAPADILKTQVLRTVVGGKTVYEKTK